MAYISEIDWQCNKHGCTRPATVEVRGVRNAPYGKWCKTHGETQRQTVEASEARQTTPPSQ